MSINKIGLFAMTPLTLLWVTALTGGLVAGQPPPPPPPSLRPLALLLQPPPAAANLIPGGRYAASRPGLSVGAHGNNGRSHDKPAAFSGNWPFVFPSSGKAATKTSTPTTTSAPPAATKSTTKEAPPAPSETILPLRSGPAPDRAADITAVDGFSQVFGRGNSVLDEPQISRCVWAIVTCCSPNSKAVRYGCFEQSGCHGAFWDTSPCERHITSSALEAALHFYL
ncbi:ran-binding protein 9 [Schistocerca serialis cubense]|uniref:ran-binding protein 9 n=2 Tax=Schistocerca TaxID=7008 RepID=UPI00214E7D73|nr:ran-binding protein 9 [Schistocerca serialis cubense]